MRRHLFNMATAVSLLLCLTATALWAVQFNKTLAIGNHYTTLTVEIADCFYLSLWKYTFDVQAMSKIERPFIRFSEDGWFVAEVETDGLDTRQVTFARTRAFDRAGKQSLVVTQYIVKLPFWFLATVFFVPPLYWLVSRHRSHSNHGQCRICGYNLTGNTSGVCPECGTATLDKLDSKAAHSVE